MRIKVDEDLPAAAVEMLRAAGYDAASVLEQAMAGWKDGSLWDAVQREHRFLVTADKGFADVRVHPPGAHAGVLLLRADQDGIQPILSLLEAVLVAHCLDLLERCVAVVTPRGIRVRRPPESSPEPRPGDSSPGE